MTLCWPVVLASASPRRRELLKQLIENFEILPADVDETLQPAEDPKEATLRLAKTKASSITQQRPNHIVLAADTLVAIQEEKAWQIFGKPGDHEEAKQMLHLLSGRPHFVTTGVCLRTPETEESFAVQTEVVFRPLTDQEIDDYVRTGDSLDKAGAYAIQGVAGNFVSEMKGSLTNVVGLPLERLEESLRRYEKGPEA